MCGTIRDERAGLAVEQRFRDFQPSDLLWIVVQLEVSKHFGMYQIDTIDSRL